VHRKPSWTANKRILVPRFNSPSVHPSFFFLDCRRISLLLRRSVSRHRERLRQPLVRDAAALRMVNQAVHDIFSWWSTENLLTSYVSYGTRSNNSADQGRCLQTTDPNCRSAVSKLSSSAEMPVRNEFSKSSYYDRPVHPPRSALRFAWMQQNIRDSSADVSSSRELSTRVEVWVLEWYNTEQWG